MQSNGVDGGDGGSVASSTPSSVSSSSVDGNTPQKKGPVVIPRASRADRASIEEQIRSQHREFDVDRYSGSVSSTSSRRGGGGTYNRRAGSEVYTSNSRSRVAPSAAATSSSRGGDGSPRRQTVGGNPRALEELSRMLSHMGAANGSDPASMSDVERIEDMMLQTALRESAEMETAAQKKRDVEEREKAEKEKAAAQDAEAAAQVAASAAKAVAAAAAKAGAEAEAENLKYAAMPPPAPEGYSSSSGSGDKSEESGQKGDDQEDLELQLALHNSAVDHRVDPEEEEEALKKAIALSLEEAGGEP